MKTLLSILTSSALVVGVSAPAAATTINALSCSASAVQIAINLAQSGDTVRIPAGTCTWTSQVSWNAPANVALIGAGSQSVVGGGDVTVIIDGISRGSDVATLSLTTNATGTFRLSGITFRGSGNSSNYTDNGTVRINGKSTKVRLDHLHFDGIRHQAMSTDSVYGVLDHCIFDMAPNSLDNAFRPEGVFATWGDQEWAAPTNFGSNEFMYVEDSVFNNGVINDCVGGGRQVFRYNTINNSAIQTHPTGSMGRQRGCRAMEIYHNTFTGGGQATFNAHFISSGALLIWGNDAGNKYQNFLTIHSMRRNSATYGQSATPNGWGYCGTSFNGTGSGWDQNSPTSTGYACLDQPGRGMGDRLSLDFPNTKNNTTNSVAWPHQALEPIYEWLDTWTGTGGGSFISLYDQPAFTNNVDYYFKCGPTNSSCSSFTGAAGTGSGLLSARPSTCTPMVAYWATDTNTLYRCTAPNTWAAYYTPFFYPHPLTTSNPIPTAPANLRIVRF